jgi:cytochrome c oxidase assembly protein subunit 20
MRRVVKTECGRNSLLYGIGGGMAIGLARFMISRQVLTSTNWAVGGFTLISLGSWEWCRYQLLQKAQKMDLIVEKLNQLEEKKRKQKQQQQQQQQQQEEQKS